MIAGIALFPMLNFTIIGAWVWDYGLRLSNCQNWAFFV